MTANDYCTMLQQAIESLACSEPNESVFINLRRMISREMSPDAAYTSIEWTMEKILESRDEWISVELVETALSLARISNTTQSPENLQKHAATLSALFRNYDPYAQRKLLELFRWFRFTST